MGQPQPLFAGRQTRPIDIWREPGLHHQPVPARPAAAASRRGWRSRATRRRSRKQPGRKQPRQPEAPAAGPYRTGRRCPTPRHRARNRRRSNRNRDRDHRDRDTGPKRSPAPQDTETEVTDIKATDAETTEAEITDARPPTTEITDDAEAPSRDHRHRPRAEHRAEITEPDAEPRTPRPSCRDRDRGAPSSLTPRSRPPRTQCRRASPPAEPANCERRPAARAVKAQQPPSEDDLIARVRAEIERRLPPRSLVAATARQPDAEPTSAPRPDAGAKRGRAVESVTLVQPGGRGPRQSGYPARASGAGHLHQASDASPGDRDQAADEIAVPSSLATAPVDGIDSWARCFAEGLRPVRSPAAPGGGRAVAHATPRPAARSSPI